MTTSIEDFKALTGVELREPHACDEMLVCPECSCVFRPDWNGDRMYADRYTHVGVDGQTHCESDMPDCPCHKVRANYPTEPVTAEVNFNPVLTVKVLEGEVTGVELDLAGCYLHTWRDGDEVDQDESDPDAKAGVAWADEHAEQIAGAVKAMLS